MSTDTENQTIQTDMEGYLLDPEQWTEDLAREMAQQEGVELTETKWELILYFRDYYEEHMIHPSMHRLLRERELKRGKDYEGAEKYRNFLYELFPNPPGPIPMLCKLAGLPKPVEEIEE